MSKPEQPADAQKLIKEIIETEAELRAMGNKPKSETEQPKSKEWLCGGTKIIKATKEEREYYAELDIACPGCPDCEPEQPNTELLIVKTIQGLTTCINNELSKLRKITFNLSDQKPILIVKALEEIADFEKTTLFKLQKAFE